ncbi:MAG: DUF421 domain-containing protein [Clostridia bacterium]|nr:DUF421 domain-containing protein [Clostridia bacterium]
MIVLFIRTLIIFAVLLLIMRLMGKRQIGEMQPFEFVITLLIAELACIPMADVSVPLIYGVVAIFAVFILHQIFTVLEQSLRTAKKIISGKPSLVLNKDGVDFKELKKNNMNVEDLMESMRSAGYFALDDLDYAIFESNGKLSALEKCGEKSEKENSLPLLVINEGKIIDQNLKISKLSKEELITIVKDKGYSIKNVGVMTLDGNGKAYIQEENKKYATFCVALKEGVKW